MDIPSSFMIPTVKPHFYNIIFRDADLVKELTPILENFRQSWHAYLQQPVNASLFNLLNASLGKPFGDKLKSDLKRAFDKFSATSIFEQTRIDLDRLYYWEPGEYKLTLHIYTASRRRPYAKTWAFSLLNADVARLRMNVQSMMEEICGVPLTSGQYQFIFAPYIKAS